MNEAFLDKLINTNQINHYISRAVIVCYRIFVRPRESKNKLFGYQNPEAAHLYCINTIGLQWSMDKPRFSKLYNAPICCP